MTTRRALHKRRSVRLRGYDYSQEGAYFVTICTHRQALLFEDDETRAVVEQCWLAIPDHFPCVELDEWVVMPNHLHGILVMHDERGDDGRGTACRAPTPRAEGFGMPTRGSLPTIVRSFKAAVTRRMKVAHKARGRPVWQRNYYEHVIRNEAELDCLRRYVLDNPVEWEAGDDTSAGAILTRPAVHCPQGERVCQRGLAR